MGDATNYAWVDSGSLSLELHPVLYPEFSPAEILTISAADFHSPVKLDVQNLIHEIEVQAALIVHVSGSSYEVSVEGAALRSSGSGKAMLVRKGGGKDDGNFHLNLSQLKIYGDGSVDLKISSPRFAKGEIVKTGWAKLDRALGVEAKSKGRYFGDLDVDVAKAFADGFAFPQLMVGEPLQLKFSKLPPELKTADLRIGFKYDGKLRASAKVGAVDWSPVLAFGITADTVNAGLVGKDGTIKSDLVILLASQGKKNKEEVLTELISVNAAQVIPQVKLAEFQCIEGFAAAFSGPVMAAQAYVNKVPLLSASIRFEGIHSDSSFNLDLMAIYSADGSLAEFEALQFASSDLMGQKTVSGLNDPQWVYKVPIHGGSASFHLLGKFLRPDATKSVEPGKPMGFILCQSGEAKKRKTGIPLDFASGFLSRISIGKGVWPKKVVPEKTSVSTVGRANANALCSSLLNVTEGATQWTPYPKTLEEALSLQMGLKGKGAPAVKEGVPASRSQVKAAMDPSTRWEDPIQKFQFVRIDKGFTVPDDKLEEWLKKRSKATPKDKTWHLDGCAVAFNKAAKDNGINVAYCVGHCLSETGGTAIAFKADDGQTYYNAFGIGAFDGSAYSGAASTAKKQGWTTPQKAIEGGLKWIAEVFMRKSGFVLNTPYKLRWNPDNPAHDQYCTGIVWCPNIAAIAAEVANLAPASQQGELLFYYPLYKDQTKPS